MFVSSLVYSAMKSLAWIYCNRDTHKTFLEPVHACISQMAFKSRMKALGLSQNIKLSMKALLSNWTHNKRNGYTKRKERVSYVSTEISLEVQKLLGRLVLELLGEDKACDPH